MQTVDVCRLDIGMHPTDRLADLPTNQRTGLRFRLMWVNSLWPERNSLICSKLFRRGNGNLWELCWLFSVTSGFM